MAESDFVVKNGLVVNTAVTINSTAFYYNGTQFANSSYFSGSANNANNLGGTGFTSYVNTAGSYALSGNIAFSGANVVFTQLMKVGANVIANTTAFFVGNSSVNTFITSNGFFVNGVAYESGGGYFKGNRGSIGLANNINDIFRVNANTISVNITIADGENAQATGPLTVANGFTLAVANGGRVSVI